MTQIRNIGGRVLISPCKPVDDGSVDDWLSELLANGMTVNRVGNGHYHVLTPPGRFELLPRIGDLVVYVIDCGKPWALTVAPPDADHPICPLVFEPDIRTLRLLVDVSAASDALRDRIMAKVP